MAQSPINSDRKLPPGLPRWVKVFGIIALVLVLLFAMLVFSGIGGSHGPGRHIAPPTPTIEVQQP